VTTAWLPKDTTTHQDHVIAHVLGATVLGYFIVDEALYILLDIGFIWTIFLDGEMGLLPHPVVVSELQIASGIKEEIKADIDFLLGNYAVAQRPLHLKLPPAQCQIKEVAFFTAEQQSRLAITGEDCNLAIETSLATAEIRVMTLEEEDNKHSNQNAKLEDVAATEHEYLHERLRQDLGREPTEAELDEWLRQHTEGY